MAKLKAKGASAIPDLDPRELAEFKAALASDQPVAQLGEATEPAEPGKLAEPALTDPPVDPPVHSRHIPVAFERPSKAKSGLMDLSARQLQQVWEEERPPKPPSKFLRAKPRGPWGWIIGGLILVAGVSVAGWFVFGRSTKFTGNNIQVVVNAPAQIASGADVAMTIDYQNQEPVDLLNGQVTLEYPEGFTFASANVESSNDFHNAFPVGRIASGHAGQLTIHGSIIGSVGSKLTITATLSYRPANFSSDFQERGSATVTISSSIISLAVEGPTKIAPNGTGGWTVTITNASDRDLSKIRLDVVVPDGLSLTKATPAATDGSTGWVINTLAKGRKSVISLTGTATGNLGDSLELLAKIGLINAAGGLDPQGQQTLLIILVNTGLTTTIAVNGQTDPATITPGDILNYTIKIANNSDSEVADVNVAATLEGSGVDIKTVTNPLRATVKDNALTWTKQQVPGLGNLKPGQNVSVNFSVSTAKTLTVTKDSDRDPHVSLSVATSAPSLVTSTNTPIPPTVALTKYATVFSMTADARYYTDNLVAVGSGPVPPVVGQTTSYRIIWSVTNTTSNATDLTVSTVLPVGVLWAGQNVGRDAGDISFDPGSRIVRWTLNTVPAGTGGRLPALTAHFDVSITPVSSQVGAVVILSDTTTATATDAYTSKAISVTASSLTTDVPNDPQAAGEGKVVAA